MAVSYSINNLANPYTSVTSGATLSSNGTTAAWSQPHTYTNFTNSNGNPVMTIPHGGDKVVIEKSATLEVKGDVVINGVNLEERLETIEQVLQIPTRDVTMEAKHPKLAELYRQYMHELEKYKTWDRIKGEDE